MIRFTIERELLITGVSRIIEEKLRQELTLQNPEHQAAQKAGRYVGNIPRTLTFFREIPGGLSVPRGFAERAWKICGGKGIEVTDNRLEFLQIPFDFQGTLRPYQQQAVASVLERSQGTLSAPTGAGKTCMALAIVAAREQPTLIICHTRELMNQWIQAIEKFLGVPADQVGVICAGKFRLGNRITVALVQSLYKRLNVVTPHVGFLVVDECHRTPGRVFSEAVSAFPAKYLLGLSATPFRRDGLGKLIFWHLGDISGQVDKQELMAQGHLTPAVVRFHRTDFTASVDMSEKYSAGLSELTQDWGRNQIICQAAANAAAQGPGIVMVLSDRKEHCYDLVEILRDKYNIGAVCLTGSLATKEREQVMADLRAGLVNVVCATGALAGEGLDLPGITTLVVGTPVKFSGRLIQFVGRALRPAVGKDTALIIDFFDHLEPVLAASAASRAQVYHQQGIEPQNG